FSSRRRHTRFSRDWSSDVCSSDLVMALAEAIAAAIERLSRPGIEGWGLRVFGGMEAAGDLVILSEHEGCTSETCAHRSHDEAARSEERRVGKEGRSRGPRAP